jgi:hypothetical protein
MNKFGIQIIGVTNFLRMKANIADNDIEELHKEGMHMQRVEIR